MASLSYTHTSTPIKLPKIGGAKRKKMVSRNDITGDAIQSKTLSKQGRDNWDKIFGKKDKKVESSKKEKVINKTK